MGDHWRFIQSWGSRVAGAPQEHRTSLLPWNRAVVMTSVRLFPERTNQRGDWALREEEKKKRCQPPNLGALYLAYFSWSSAEFVVEGPAEVLRRNSADLTAARACEHSQSRRAAHLVRLRFLDAWCTSVMQSKLEPMKKVAPRVRFPRCWRGWASGHAGDGRGGGSRSPSGAGRRRRHFLGASVDVRRDVSRHSPSGRRASTRSGPPLPPAIFIGSAATKQPSCGSCSSPVRFSKIGVSALQSATCEPKSVEGP